MDLELRGQTAIVTGASRGIGLAIVEALAAEGAHVVAGARSSSAALDKLVAEGGVRWVAVDLASASGIAELARAAGDRIDILVNNVGSAPARPDGFLNVTDEHWHTTLDLNLMAAVRMTRTVLPTMITRGSGAIVNIASVNSALPDPLVIDYSAAKAALAAFSKALSKEFGPKGIRVNTVSPGPVETDLWLAPGGVADVAGKGAGVSPDAIRAAAAAATTTGRFSQPREIADAVLLLASSRSANTTGADLRIDGGYTPTW
ncbi:oxidoreductase [Nocardia sp. NPDC004722]